MQNLVALAESLVLRLEVFALSGLLGRHGEPGPVINVGLSQPAPHGAPGVTRHARYRNGDRGEGGGAT